jgi:hypothetical protein
VPAVLIYWLFPNNQVAVSGPFAGLTVKASGAFAAYLIIFAAAYIGIITNARDMIGGLSKEFWTLKADIKLVHPDGRAIPWSQALMKNISVQPVTYDFSTYQAKMKLERQREGDFPLVVIRLPKFREHYIPLNKMVTANKIEIDSFHKVLTIKKPVVIEELPSGGGDAALATSARGDQRVSESSAVPP